MRRQAGRVPWAEPLLTASAEGAASLLSFGSAQPQAVDNYTAGAFHAFEGRALAVLRAGFTPGECHSIAMSHGEGKFVVSEEMAKALFENGQVATQYVDEDGDPTMNGEWNINGSSYAIEGITSPDGRILGKMGHSERYGERLYKNVTGDKYQPIFEGGVNYFRQK